MGGAQWFCQIVKLGSLTHLITRYSRESDHKQLLPTKMGAELRITFESLIFFITFITWYEALLSNKYDSKSFSREVTLSIFYIIGKW